MKIAKARRQQQRETVKTSTEAPGRLLVIRCCRHRGGIESATVPAPFKSAPQPEQAAAERVSTRVMWLWLLLFTALFVGSAAVILRTLPVAREPEGGFGGARSTAGWARAAHRAAAEADARAARAAAHASPHGHGHGHGHGRGAGGAVPAAPPLPPLPPPRSTQ